MKAFLLQQAAKVKKKTNPRITHVYDSDGEESAHVDESIEDEQDVADGGLGIDEDFLSGLEHLRILALVLVLVDESGCDVGLEDTSSDREEEEADEERRDTVSGLEHSWRSTAD